MVACSPSAKCSRPLVLIEFSETELYLAGAYLAFHNLL